MWRAKELAVATKCFVAGHGSWSTKDGPMTRARLGSWGLAVAVLVLLASQSMSAIGPAFVVVHGGALQNPIVLRPEIGSLMFLWAGGNFYEHQREMKIPPGLEGRRYFDYDVFWGRFTPEEILKPEMASQHGRLYLAMKDQAAAVVLTSPVMTTADGTGTHAPAMPIPSRLEDFVSGRTLTRFETDELAAARVPIK
jgi:hypothetical protein